MDYFNLIERWVELNECKRSIVFGAKPFDQKEFVLLVKETSLAVRDFRSMTFDFDNNVRAIRNRLFDFSQVIAELAKYTADCLIGSDDYAFFASQAVARLLLIYATTPCKVMPTDETGVLYGNNEDCGLFCPSAEDMNSEYWTQTFEYDPENGDLTKFIELAEASFAIQPF